MRFLSILLRLYFRFRISIHACTTFSGNIRVMQRLSVGHVLSWHGEQSTSSLITLPISYSDSVYLGSLGPISTTTGLLSATAKCLGPESNVIKSIHFLTSTLRTSRVIDALERLIKPFFDNLSISSASLVSPCPEFRTILQSATSLNKSAVLANPSAVQSFEEP